MPPPLSLTPGTRIGSYEVLALLGEGGMGQVYRARDTKLGRDVALKILTASFAQDADRLARFEREAKTLASLNHANIAHVYDAGRLPQEPARASQGGEVTYLAMELVEGEDLSALIKRGPMPAADALPIARQIAIALEAAHEQGIVHRDLKPANIKLRPDGVAKVLDFGLAKALDPAAGAGDGSSNLANSPTITSPAMTMRGMILGTAAYMAPEQAKGKPVDKRADIWAFGCVLYEMLAGRRAFAGDDAAGGSSALANPKSSTLTVPSSRTLMLAGFRSRWMIPCSCAASSASAICFAIGKASSSGMGPRAIRCERSSPSTSSITSAVIPSASSMPWMCAMLG